MRKLRPSWLIVGVVVVVIAAVPALRHQARLAWRTLKPVHLVFIPVGEEATVQISGPPSYLRLLDQLRSYQARSVAFVEEHYPDDPRMLTAAALLADEPALLERAVHLGDDPATWAAYADHLMSGGLGFERVALGGVDPEDAVGMQQERWRVAQSGLPDRLAPEEAEPILGVLRRWQAADLENAAPVVYEFLYLYGLHRDADALTAWVRASRLPTLTDHSASHMDIVTDLLIAMGMSKSDARLASSPKTQYRCYSCLRSAARIAVYEGRLAQIEGRAQDAVTWWQSVFDLGRHLQDSSETLVGWLVGASTANIGAAPVWQWTHDGVSGIPDGPLLGGRIFYGPQHAFYLSVMGPEADEDMRSAIVASKVRSALLRGDDRPEITGDLQLAAGYCRYAGTLLLAGVALMAVFAAVGTWARRSADRAIRPGPLWDPVLVGFILLPVLLAALAVPLLKESLPARMPDLPDVVPFDIPVDRIDFGPLVFFGPPILSVLLAVFLTSLAGHMGRAPGASVLVAWRGYIRRTFPPVIALFALVFLVLIITASNIQKNWAAYWHTPGNTEMSWIIEQLGPEWHNPTIPPDAWRAAPPPPPQPSHPLPPPGGWGMRGPRGGRGMRGAPGGRGP